MRPNALTPKVSSSLNLRWLARSFITCSKNNLLGANQKDKKFWHKGVEARFNKLAEEETEPDDDGLKVFDFRNHEQLKRRWKLIAERSRKFMAVYRASHSQDRTGFSTEQDYIDWSVTEYYNKHGE